MTADILPFIPQPTTTFNLSHGASHRKPAGPVSGARSVPIVRHVFNGDKSDASAERSAPSGDGGSTEKYAPSW